ncbi:hypothetical protein D3C78_796510 [compost metagenome]
MQDAKQDEIDKAAGKRLANGDMQNVGEHKCQAIEERVDDIKHRCHEQERELNRFGNARQERGQRCRNQQPRYALFILGFGGVIHRQTRPEQAEHHGDKASGHKA